jgi:hypothetical protein
LELLQQTFAKLVGEHDGTVGQLCLFDAALVNALVNLAGSPFWNLPSFLGIFLARYLWEMPPTATTKNTSNNCDTIAETLKHCNFLRKPMLERLK